MRLRSQGEANTEFQGKVLCPGSDLFLCCRQLRSSVLSLCNSYTARDSPRLLMSLIPRIKSFPAQNTQKILVFFFFLILVFLIILLTYDIAIGLSTAYQMLELSSNSTLRHIQNQLHYSSYPNLAQLNPKSQTSLSNIITQSFLPTYLAIIKLNPISFLFLSLKAVRVSSGMLHLCLSVSLRLQHL